MREEDVLGGGGPSRNPTPEAGGFDGESGFAVRRLEFGTIERARNPPC